jgi:hypothetical protein
MANNNLAALAALAGLAYAANRGKASNKAGDQGNVAASDDTDYIANMGRNYGGQDVQAEDGTLSKFKRNTESSGELYSPDEPITRPTARAASKASSKPTAKATRDDGTSTSAPVRTSVRDTGDETARLLKRSPAPVSAPDTGDETARLLKRVPPTAREMLMSTKPSSGQMQSGLELAAGAPTAKGLQAMASAAKNIAARQELAKGAARRAAEGLSAEEAAAVQQAMRENKTMNPMAWMAGPKGMSNFKKGGMVKAKAPVKRIEMSAPKASSASRRADGIATKGKTRGKIC